MSPTRETGAACSVRRRGTPFAAEGPVALLSACYENAAHARRWQELRRQIGTEADGPPRLVDAGEELRRFLGPVCDSIIEDSLFTQSWPAGGPWRPVVG